MPGKGLDVSIRVDNGLEPGREDARGFELDLHIPASLETEAWGLCRQLMMDLLALQKIHREGEDSG